jgi:hypothetical protein
MNDKRFWDIIQTAAGRVSANPDWFGKEMLQTLREELVKLPPDEILQFRRVFDQKVDEAYRNDLWGAAYLINGGCSDDGFHYFRCWLIGRGKKVYSRALKDPDTLADILDGDWPMEATLDGAAARAWEEKTGRSDMEFYEELEKRGRLPVESEEGEDWDFDDNDEMRRRFPRLCKCYLSESED